MNHGAAPPAAGLVEGSDGALYGTTSSGGSIAAAGDDAITVALVYRTSRVRPEGAPRVPDTATYDAFNGAVYGNRVPIAQQFSVAVDGGGREAFTVVVVEVLMWAEDWAPSRNDVPLDRRTGVAASGLL